MFKHHTQIRLHHTDAAGLLFFAHQLVLVHDAYEELLIKLGFTYENHLKEAKYLFPIVHIESDYKKPLFVGDKITIDVNISHVGTTSFTFDYKIHDTAGDLVGTAKTVHVCVDKNTKKKATLPKDYRSALEKTSGLS